MKRKKWIKWNYRKEVMGVCWAGTASLSCFNGVLVFIFVCFFQCSLWGFKDQRLIHSFNTHRDTQWHREREREGKEWESMNSNEGGRENRFMCYFIVNWLVCFIGELVNGLLLLLLFEIVTFLWNTTLSGFFSTFFYALFVSHLKERKKKRWKKELLSLF